MNAVFLQKANVLLAAIKSTEKHKCICDACEVEVFLEPLIKMAADLEKQLADANKYIKWLDSEYKKEYDKNNHHTRP
ncbi:hypothetical protein M0R72_21575 [Candidatus Pacearchaeota archaeon]|jgi:hypothetical protein|nr:hypothetical protein [Candidatus Pacearchaeota archaeon]